MAAILSQLGLYGGNRKTKLPLSTNTRIHTPEGQLGNFCLCTIGRMLGDCTLRSLDACRAILHVSFTSKSPDCVIAHQLDRCPPLVRLVPIGQTGLVLLPRVFDLGL
jgi:hypothetical protein